MAMQPVSGREQPRGGLCAAAGPGSLPARGGRGMARVGMLVAAAVLAATGLAVAGAAWAQSSTLDAVRKRGAVVCGVSGLSPGFSMPDSAGIMRGIDADYCRAVAAATLGDGAKAQFRVLTAQTRFTALATGEVDVLYANATWTMGREGGLGLLFTGVTFHDGQTFMVRTSSGIKHATELDGATICMLSGGTAEGNAADFFRAHGMKFTPLLIEASAEVRQAFVSGRCDALTNDASALAGFRSTLGDAKAQYMLLPELISTEPLGGAVRKGDERWFDIVRWTQFAAIAAEELGITQANLDQQAAASRPAIRRFMGTEGELGKQFGLSNSWARDVIAAVGNAGEIWERDIAPIGIPRGVNRLWRDGGTMFAPPMR